jgi:hypothetical protein
MRQINLDKAKIRQAVKIFSEMMKIRMLAKYKQGLRGWDDPTQESIIRNKLADNIGKNDWLDVANLAMMLFRFKHEDDIIVEDDKDAKC